MISTKWMTISAAVLLASANGFAQEETKSELNDYLNAQDLKKVEEAEEAPQEAPAAPVTQSKNVRQNEDLSVLGTLAPYDDVAVIQRRYLPKTHRFELFPNLGIITNQAFFMSSSLGLNFGFYFSELLGLELSYASLSTSERKVTTDLREKAGITTQSFINSESYMGADIKWSPIFGKMAFSNRSIIPFDMYFALGGGQMRTNQNTQPTVIHLGTGQVFALTKSIAARWDLSWYTYKSKTALNNQEDMYQDLKLSLGISLFFPGAKYR